MKQDKNEKPKLNATPLPLHSLADGKFPIHVEDIRYNNPYDFTREHRHDYFEILFLKKGGGSQLIDFILFHSAKGSS